MVPTMAVTTVDTTVDITAVITADITDTVRDMVTAMAIILMMKRRKLNSTGKISLLIKRKITLLID